MIQSTVRNIRCGALLLQSGARHACCSAASTNTPSVPLTAGKTQRTCLACGSHSHERHAPLDTLRLYEQPALYDVTFPGRQFSNEVDFLLGVAQQHAGRTPQTFVELGCGPARHSRLLAARGLCGFAVDSSAVMLEHAGGCAQQDGVTVEFVGGDIRQGCLPAGTAVDLAFMLFGTLSHLLSNEDALAAFAAAAAALAPRGIFVVEMASPMDLFNGILESGDTWEVDDTPFGHLRVNYGSEDGCDDMEVFSQTLDRNVKVTATKGDNKKVLAEGVVRQRFYTSQEVYLLSRAAGLRVVGQYGALTLPHMAPDDEDAFSLVMVLQKQ